MTRITHCITKATSDILPGPFQCWGTICPFESFKKAKRTEPYNVLTIDIEHLWFKPTTIPIQNLCIGLCLYKNLAILKSIQLATMMISEIFILNTSYKLQVTDTSFHISMSGIAT